MQIICANVLFPTISADYPRIICVNGRKISFIGARKNICIRYMLNESREMPVNHRGAGLKSLGMNTLHVLFQLGC
jgi:hypothetical protein